MAKKNCKFSIVYKGRKIEFNSDKELDSFLHTHEQELIALANANLESLNKIFSADQREVTKAIIEEIKIDVANVQVEIIRDNSDPSESERIYKIPNSKSVSNLIKDLGWVTPFNQDLWERNKEADYISKGLSETEAKQKIQDEIKSWEYITNKGNEIHNYIDSILNNKPFTAKTLTDSQMENIKTQVERFVEAVKRDLNDDNLTILSEFAIKSKFLNADKETILGQEGITSINGRLDFTVIDKMGQVHIYDWKVSPRKPGNWGETSNSVIRKDEERLGYRLYPSSKKESINYQMGAYAAMFKQYGLTVESVNVVPVTLQLDREADGFTVKDLTNITIEKPIRVNDFALRGRIADKISQYISGNVDPKQIPASLDSTANKLTQLFPKHTSKFQIQQFEANKNYYLGKKNFVQLLKEGDKKANDYKYKFYTDGLADPRWVYSEDEAALDKNLDDYIARLQESKANELINLGKNIKRALADKITLEEVGQSLSDKQNLYLAAQLKKYVDGHWEFEQNEDLNNAGFFLFRKNGKMEIVMITSDPLYTQFNLGMSQSILGEFVKTRDWDKRRILSASNAHLDMFKALAYISENRSEFEGVKIAGIKTLNPWHRNVVTVSNEQLLDNWAQLMDYKRVRNTLDNTLFVDDVTAALTMAEDIIESVGINVDGLNFTTDLAYTENAIEELDNFIAAFVRRHKKLSDWDRRELQDPVWQAYEHLLTAQRALRGYRTHTELDAGDWFNGNVFNLVGLRVSSVQTSPSANMRELGDLVNDYSHEVGTTYHDTTLPVRLALDAFYKEAGRIKAIGGEASYFLSWFEDIDNLVLKNPDNPDFNGQPKAKQALTMVLETLAKLRWRSEAEIEAAKESGKYYELPLMEAKFNRQARRLGVKKALGHMVTKYKNLHEGVFGTKEDIVAKQTWEKTESSVYNRFEAYDRDSSKRYEYIQKQGSGFFETDVERVFRESALAYIRQQKSRKYIPIIMGMKMALAYQDEVEGNKLTNTRKAFDDYVKKKIYGEPIVDEKLQPLLSYLSLIKSGFSKLALGLNSRSFAREVLQGTYAGASRAAVNRIPGLDFKHYSKAYNWVVQHAKDNVEVAGLARQLGATYRMANMSLNEIAQQSKVNWLGIKNWSSDTLFLTSTSPDFLHRTIILVAKMMADGSLDAHSLDENGALKYDWTKDERFKIFIAGDKNNPQYLYQKTLYLKNLDEWNSKGYNLKEGDPLPRAYTIREARTFKNWGDLLYGHYDTESRALINDSFLGSFFMQYRTFVTAKLEQWLIAPGSYNMDRLVLQKDSMTGEELWEVAVYPNADNTGMPNRKIVRKSEVTSEELDGGYARPYYAWEGDPIEGMAHSMWRFVKAHGTLNQEQINAIWKDPFEKKNLATGLHDLVIMMMLALVIKALFGEDTIKDMSNQSWITQWTYAVSLGSTQDGPIHQVLAGMFSDLNPPLAGSVNKMVNTTWSVINGDDRIGWAITQNVGALRELQGVAKAITE